MSADSNDTIPTPTRALPPLSRGTRWLVVLIAVFAALNSAVWSITIPAGQAPDEPNHFSVAKFTAENGRVPEFGVDDGMGIEVVDPQGSRIGNYSYAGAPQLPYVVAAVFIALPTDSEWMDYRQGRAAGAAWLFLTVLLAFGLAREVSRSTRISIAVAAMVAMWPQLTFVSAYVNTDGFTVMAGTGLMWSWWRAVRRDWDVNSTATLGAFSGLVLQGKFTGYVLLVLTLVIVATTLRGSVRHVGSRLAVAAGSSLFVASWWLVSAFGTYGFSDPYATGRAAQLAESLNLGSGAGSDRGLGLWQMLVDAKWIEITLRSFVGVFGWMSLPLSGWLYLLVAALVLMGVIGSSFHVAARIRLALRRPGAPARIALVSCTFAPLMLMPVLSVRNSFLNDFQAQGRYLFAALVPLLIGVALGLRELGTTRRRQGVLLAFGAAVVWFTNVVGLVDTLAPGHQQPLDQWWGQWQSALLLTWSTAGAACILVAMSLGRRAIPDGVDPGRTTRQPEGSQPG